MLRLSARMFAASKTMKKNNSMNIGLPFNLSSIRFNQSESQTTKLQSLDTRKQFSTPHIVSLMDYIRDLGFNEDEIKIAIEEQPDLRKKSPVVWNSIIRTLVDCGLERGVILSIIKKWPDVLSLKKGELDKNIEAWLRCQLPIDSIFNIWETHPSFLQVNHTTVEKRIKQFQIYFETKKGVARLLLLAPNVIDEDWNELLDKLNYLDELCIGKTEVILSGVLAHSALHIRTRHEFLIRAGIYKRPGKEYIKKLSKNPKLTDIVNRSDKDFAFNVAALTLLEYEVFSEIYEKEYEQTKNTEYDSEDEYANAYKQHYKRKPSRR